MSWMVRYFLANFTKNVVAINYRICYYSLSRSFYIHLIRSYVEYDVNNEKNLKLLKNITKILCFFLNKIYIIMFASVLYLCIKY